MKKRLEEILGIKYPIIMAPMFLVSNTKMLIAAAEVGITGCVPALNYRTDKEFRTALQELKEYCKGPFGVNLIANQSNYRFDEQLKTCLEFKVDYIITSLGSPQSIIEACRPLGIKVFCDVIDMNYAKKVVDMGCDALIAVSSEAGGHLGNLSYKTFIPSLVNAFDVPVISAGGVGNNAELSEKLELGACGVSVGSPFIATFESDVNEAYKNACVEYGAKDIVTTTKLSGVPCTVINTPYVQSIGVNQNWLERWLSGNKRIKKFIKMFTYMKGMNTLRNAAFGATYQTVWCAGKSIEHTHQISSVKDVVERLTKN